MEISQLEAFVKVANEGSLTRAADVLGITQPAVTARLQTLEVTLDGKLFERQGRTLQLTPLGDYLLPYAQRILALTDETRQAAHHFQAGTIGQIRLAAPTPFLMSFLTPVLIRFRQHHPDVDILIRERNKTTILDLLQDNVMTLGFVNAPVFDKNIDVIARFRDTIIPVVSPRHWLARLSPPLDLATLIQYPIFRVSLFPRMTAFMDELAEQARTGSGGAVVALPMVMAYELTLRGHGVTFLPQTYVQSALDTQHLLTLQIADVPPLFSEPLLIKTHSRKLDIVHQYFVDSLIKRWNHLRIN